MRVQKAGETPALLLYSALVGTRDAHVLPVFRNRAASDLDTLRLKDAGDLLVGQRSGWIFFFDELLDAALQDQQRRVAAFGALHAFGEEVPQFEYALRSVGIFIRHRAADGGRMHADFFSHLLDHHGLQLIDALFQKILLARNDGITDLHDGLLALLDILDELDGALVALFDVIAGVLVVGVLGQEPLIGRIQAKLWYVFIVHQTEPLIAMLDESDVRLNQSRGGLVVALPRTRIERLDELQRRRNRFQRTTDRFGNFLVLFHLHGAQMLVNDGDRVGENLGGAIPVFLLRMLLLDVAQLIEQALTQVAACYPRWIQLTDQLERFVQLSERKRRLIYRPGGRRGRRNWRRSNFHRQFMSGRNRRRHGDTANLRRRTRSVFPAEREIVRTVRDFTIDVRGQAQRLSLFQQAFLHGRIDFRRGGSGHAHQFVIARDQVPVLVQVADDQLSCFTHSAAYRQGTQLPHQVICQVRGLGEKVLK